MSGPITVLIVDDETIVREGLRAIIEVEADMEVVGEARDGIEALTAARELHPAVALVDVQMPRMDGVESTRRLVELSPAPRVIVLTTFDRNEYVYDSMRAGASGFLLKDVRRDQLTDAIRTVVAGDTLLAPTITRRLIEQFCSRPTPGTATPSELGTSPSASSRCFPFWGAASRTVRWPPGWLLQRRRSRPMSPTSSQSLASATVLRLWSSRTKLGSSHRAAGLGIRRRSVPASSNSRDGEIRTRDPLLPKHLRRLRGCSPQIADRPSGA